MAVTAMAVTSSASRSSRSRAAVSPAEAVSKRTVVRPSNSALAMRPRWTPMATSRTVGRPKYAAVAGRSAVSGPRPSSARIAHHMTSWPRYQPPPQSPVSRPSARNRVVRPSGARPAQLMPAPQVTATPQAGWPGDGVSPARSTANVSLATAEVSDQPRRRSAAASCSSSSGRSAPARQLEICLATSPSEVTPACAAASATISPSIRMAPSTPWCSWLVPGPRTEASSEPSAATSATSVLLFPPSIASTAGSEDRASAKEGQLLRPRKGIARSRRASAPSSPRRACTARPAGARAAQRPPGSCRRAARRRARVPRRPTRARRGRAAAAPAAQSTREPGRRGRSWPAPRSPRRRRGTAACRCCAG